VSLDDVDLTLIDTLEDVGALLRWLGESRPYHALGLDTETSGLDVFRDRIRLVQIGDHRHGWALDWERWRGLFEDVVRRWDGDWLLHNSTFDLSFFDRAGIHIPRPRVHDTMVQARINEPHMAMGLKPQATRHVDSAAGGLQAELAGTAWTWETVPIDYQPYWVYGALDPVLTYKLHEHHYPIVMRDAPKAYELEMAVLWVVQRMRRFGTYVDREFTRQKLEQFSQYCTDVEKWCKSRYGISPGSNQAVIQALQSEGVEFSKLTKSGALSLDGDVLEGIDHPLAQAVFGRRKAQKLVSTYLRFYLENADENELIHPSFNSLGAKTGRMSCSEPNLQNLPRRGTSKFGDVVRSCIKTRWGTPWDDARSSVANATDPNRGSLIFCDYSQIEMRMLAHFAEEDAMIQAFKSEGDFFVNLARQIFQDDTITKKDPRRQITKNSGYAQIYGAGVRKFALTAGIPESQARDFLNRFDTLYPGVKRFQTLSINTAMERKRGEGIAYTTSPLTGRRFVAEQNKEYALINYMIQGAAAEVNKMKLVELDAAGLGEWMFATVHDEVLLDVPGEHVRDVIQTLVRVMNDDELLSVPIAAEASFGERWGTKQDWVD
jgi:DNA polymerase-1